MPAIDKKMIDRINELARKSRETGLTPEEQKEQQKLRADYIAAFRGNSFFSCIEVSGKI